MEITDITPQKREGLHNIFIDGEYAFSLSTETVMQLRIVKGMTVTDTEIENMRSHSDAKRCLSAALSYVSRRRCTRRMLCENLSKKQFSTKSIHAAAEKLEHYGYINDEEYAKDYMRVNLRDKGIRRVKAELLAKGITDVEIEVDTDAEYDVCLACAGKFMKNRGLNIKERQRLYRYLLYRGFEMSNVCRTVENVFGADTD